MMRGGSLYITDQLLNKRPFNHIVQHLSFLQRRALFEKHLKVTSPLGSKGSLECKHIGVQRYRHSRAIQMRSIQSPSRPIVHSSRRLLTTRLLSSGMPQRGSAARRLSAIAILSIQSPSRPMELLSRRVPRMGSSSSGMWKQGSAARHLRAIRVMSIPSPSRPMVLSSGRVP